MKLTRDQKVRLGLFWLIAGGLTLAVFGLVIGGRLLERRDIYFVEFYNQPVSGLQVGGSVRFQGIQVGRVENIRFDPDEPRRVIVELSIKEGTPIKDDVEAQLAMVGITGMRQVELIGGSRDAETLPPGSKIPPGSSLFDDITGDAQMIIGKVELMLNNLNVLIGAENQQKFRRILASIDYVLDEGKEPFTVAVGKLDRIMEHLGQAAESAAELSDRAAVLTDRLAGIAERDEFEKTFETMVESIGDIRLITERLRYLADLPEWDSIIEKADGVTRDLSLVNLAEISEEVSLLLEQFGHSFSRMDMTIIRSSRDIIRSMEILNEILEDLNDFSRRISEDPSSLIRF